MANLNCGPEITDWIVNCVYRVHTLLLRTHRCWIVIIPANCSIFISCFFFLLQAVQRVVTNPAVMRRARPRPARWSAPRCSRCGRRSSASSPTWTLKPFWGRPRCVATGGSWRVTPPSGQECCWRTLASPPRFSFFLNPKPHSHHSDLCANIWTLWPSGFNSVLKWELFFFLYVQFLCTLSQWCTQTHSLILQNLKPRQRGKKETKEEYLKTTRYLKSTLGTQE